MKAWLALASAVLWGALGCSSSSGTGTGGNDSGGSGQTGTTNGTGQSATGTGGSSASTSATTASGSTDPLEAARASCIAEINRLRATKGLTAYARWTDAETCVDQQATSDEMTQSPHAAWASQQYTCDGRGQNECEGQGVAGIVACLDQMWGEKDQPGCSGCDACDTAYDPNCPNCDFSGQNTGNVCGHYVNLSAKYFTEAACGFSSLGGWDAINFQ